jgi:hypothetical protein
MKEVKKELQSMIQSTPTTTSSLASNTYLIMRQLITLTLWQESYLKTCTADTKAIVVYYLSAPSLKVM